MKSGDDLLREFCLLNAMRARGVVGNGEAEDNEIVHVTDDGNIVGN
jgi:autonomous glycyl radical cofactor GrcA